MGFRARFRGLGCYIVKGSRRDLCDRRDIVEKSKQSDTQKTFAPFSGQVWLSRRYCSHKLSF